MPATPTWGTLTLAPPAGAVMAGAGGALMSSVKGMVSSVWPLSASVAVMARVWTPLGNWAKSMNWLAVAVGVLA